MEPTLFFSVWRNVYLFRTIYNHVKYEENKYKEFKSIKEMKEYSQREFIGKLVLKGAENLNYGDLPMNGVLRVVQFRSVEASITKGSNIPDGVVEVGYFNNEEKCDLLSLPLSVETISIQHYLFNYEIPKSIKKLVVYPCKDIELSAESIPSTITSLSLGSFWNNNRMRLSHGVFKNGLLDLDIRNYSPNTLDGDVLPHSLTVLKVGFPISTDKNNLFKFNLPNLKSLFLFSQSIITQDMLPNQIYKGLIPNSVTRLEVQVKNLSIGANSLPASIIDLSIGGSLKSHSIFKGMLPKYLQSLSIRTYHTGYFTIQMDSLPKTLTRFEIDSTNGSGWNEEIQIGLFPDSLTYLRFGEGYNKWFIPGALPCNLQTLILGDSFTRPLEPNMLPQSLTYLKVPRGYDHPFPENTLPVNLKSLFIQLYSDFNHPLEPNILPKSLTELSIPRGYSIKINEIEPFAQLSKLEITKKSFDTIFNENDQSILSSSIQHLKIINLNNK